MTINIETANDLFAGGGGCTTGAKQAGVHVRVAANHWAEAVNIHTLNHPETTHVTQDLQQANFHEWPDADLLMASPACQGHSRARGEDKPHHDACRSTAWAVIAYVEARRPKALFVENVPEFAASWQLYPQWKDCLVRLGYVVQENVLDASDFGVPQHRTRLFVTGVRADLASKPVVVRPPAGIAKIPARDILSEGGKWSPVYRAGARPRAEATLKRYERGRAVHGEEFILAYFGQERGGRSLDQPLGTVLTRDRYALVRGDRMRMLTLDESRHAMGFPAGYILPDRHKPALAMLGNAVCPTVAKAVIEALRAAS